MKNTLLIVDDEPNVLSALQRALIDEPYEIHCARDGREALAIMATRKIKVLLSDEKMPGMDGAALLAKVKESYPETVRIMLTGHASLESTMTAVNQGEIYRFFIKPWNDMDLLMAIRSAMEKFDLEAENRRLLGTIRHQAFELKVMEKIHPGITRLEKDENGNLLLPELTPEEIAEILDQCAKIR